jgi:hypothetical protein
MRPYSPFDGRLGDKPPAFPGRWELSLVLFFSAFFIGLWIFGFGRLKG